MADGQDEDGTTRGGNRKRGGEGVFQNARPNRLLRLRGGGGEGSCKVWAGGERIMTASL